MRNSPSEAMGKQTQFEANFPGFDREIETPSPGFLDSRFRGNDSGDEGRAREAKGERPRSRGFDRGQLKKQSQFKANS